MAQNPDDDIYDGDPKRGRMEELECENEELRAMLHRLAGYANEVRDDRAVKQEGEVVGAWQTLDWIEGLREIITEVETLLCLTK